MASKKKTVPKVPLGSRAQAAQITAELHKLYPGATCALTHDSPFELLIATILSAQCTDERVNIVTKDLFRHCPTPQAMAECSQEKLEEIIRSTGFFRNKAKNIKGAAQMLVGKFRGGVPRTMEDLLQLPGVARKTANVVLGTAYGIAMGVVVDTHVTRLAGRLGLTRHIEPEKIEKDLMALLPREEWIDLSHLLIWHGRKVCNARKPLCGECSLNRLCPSANIAVE